MKFHVGIGQVRLLRASQLAGDQIGDMRQAELVVEAKKVGFDLAGLHQMDAREQDAINVEKRLHTAGIFLLEEIPLRLRKAEVMVGVVASDAGLPNRFKLLVRGSRVNDQWRIELLEDIAVLFEHE